MSAERGPWPCTDAELVELAIALDHRFAEAEAGNAYADWLHVGALLLDVEHECRRRGFGTGQDVAATERRLFALMRRYHRAQEVPRV